MIIIGHGAFARPMARPCWRRRQARPRCGRRQGRLERLQHAPHRRRPRRRARCLCALPAEGGRDTARHSRRRQGGRHRVVYLLGADEIDMAALGHAFVVYQGTHGDAGAHRADVILARRRLHREIGDLRQHRRPAADDPPGRSSRPARRARTGRSCAPCQSARRHACPGTSSMNCARPCTPAPHLARIDQLLAGRSGRPCRTRGRGGRHVATTPSARRSRIST